jgi:hypothetical protein
MEAHERIWKAKAKAEIDERARRHSSMNKKTDDVHAIEKCENMAKKKTCRYLHVRNIFPLFEIVLLSIFSM